jgi:hypothetical protein
VKTPRGRHRCGQKSGQSSGRPCWVSRCRLRSSTAPALRHPPPSCQELGSQTSGSRTTRGHHSRYLRAHVRESRRQAEQPGRSRAQRGRDLTTTGVLASSSPSPKNSTMLGLGGDLKVGVVGIVDCAAGMWAGGSGGGPGGVGAGGGSGPLLPDVASSVPGLTCGRSGPCSRLHAFVLL